MTSFVTKPILGSPAISPLSPENLYCGILEAVQQGIWVLAGDGSTLFINGPMAQLLKSSVHDLMDRSPFDFLESRERPESGASLRFDSPLQDLGGSRPWVSVSITPVLDDLGQIAGRLVMFTDITDRKRAELELAELAAIVDSSDDAIISKTLDGVITTWNASAERMFGYSAAEAIGQPVTMLMPERRRLEEVDILDRLRRGMRIENFETIRQRRNGEEFPVSLTVSPLRDQYNRVIGASKILRDITARKRAEELTRKQQADLARMSRITAIGRMATGIAHELNQPLGSIINYAGALRLMVDAGAIEPAQIRDGLDRIASETSRAGEIIRRMRFFCKKQDGKREWVKFNNLVMEATTLMLFELRNARVEVRTNLAPALPEVFVDAVQMVQVLVNLIRNAIDSMSDPRISNRILVLTSTYNVESIQVTVTDSGCGVAEGQLDQIFEDFYTTKPDGLGLGLAISRTIVESVGGRLSGSLNPIAGMTFTIQWPRQLGGRHDGSV